MCDDKRPDIERWAFTLLEHILTRYPVQLALTSGSMKRRQGHSLVLLHCRVTVYILGYISRYDDQSTASRRLSGRSAVWNRAFIFNWARIIHTTQETNQEHLRGTVHRVVAASANDLTLRDRSLTRMSSFARNLWVLLAVGSILLIVLLPIDYGVPIGYGLYSIHSGPFV